MPFVQRTIEPKYLSRTSLFDDDGHPRVADEELQAVTNNTLANALRQLASLVLVANEIFEDLGDQLQDIKKRSDVVRVKISVIEKKVLEYDPKQVTVPESDISAFAHRKIHFTAKQDVSTNLFKADTRPKALQELYEGATKTPVHHMRQMDRWRRDGHRSSRFFLCTPVLGAKRRKIRNRVDIDIETTTPAAVEELRRWTSNEALGDITVTTDYHNRIATTVTDGETTDGTLASDDEAIDHKLPSPEEQLHVIALKFPAEIVAVDVSGRSFDRMSMQRRSLLHSELNANPTDGDPNSIKRRTRTRKPRSRRRNTLAGTDQKEIRDALTAGEETPSSPTLNTETESTRTGAVARSKSSDILRTSPHKKDSPPDKKSHFNTLKQWGKSRYDRFMNKSSETKQSDDIDDFNLYETVTMKRKRDLDKERRTHERNSSISSSEKSSSINLPVNTLSSVMNIAVKLRESSAQRRQRRSGGNKDEPPHSSSGNWSASSESGRASIGSEITAHPKSTSTTTSSNSLNQQPPSSVNSRRRFVYNSTTSGSCTSEGTLTPDIIHDLHEDETSSTYSCDTEGYYTSFHLDSGLKTLKEEELPCTPLHSTSAFSNSSSNNTVLSAENEYELFGKGSTSTTTSSAGTVCTTLRASESNRSLIIGPAVPERKSSLSKLNNKSSSPESSLERDFSSDKTGTVKRSPIQKVVAVVHQDNNNGDISPDSGHNTSSSPIESINSPNGVRSGSDFEFSESSDMEGPERIERIRVKTTINSSRIPSMCVITPPHSDDESDLNQKLTERNNTKNINGMLITVNPQSGYATIDQPDCSGDVNQNIKKSAIRAPSPSGGTVTIKTEPAPNKIQQPTIKSSLLPLNSMFGKIKNNFVSFTEKRKSKSPVRPVEDFDSGEYVTIADVRNNNDNTYVNDIVNKNLTTVLSGKIRETEYVSLNELPGNNNNNNSPSNIDSLERKKRQGARVMLDAEGKVVYSSDSLRRRKGSHTTFEPGPFVKPSDSPSQSPVPLHRAPKVLRPITTLQSQQLAKVSPTEFNRPLSPQLGKIVIKAGISSPTAEIVRMPPSTIVTARPMSPKNGTRGAYVHIQDKTGRPQSPVAQDKDRVNLNKAYPVNHLTSFANQEVPPSMNKDNMYRYRDQILDDNYGNEYYRYHTDTIYNTLPTKKTQYFQTDLHRPERSVTPDITRGLSRNYDTNSMDRRSSYQQARHFYRSDQNLANQQLGIPVQMPQIRQVPYSDDSFKISPIDPRNSGTAFQSSTPSKQYDLKSAINLESKLMSPKKSTMSNEELYAMIHKSKKKMNIETEVVPESPKKEEFKKHVVKSPETGYLGGDKSRSRLSWSPNKGEYVDFNTDIDKISPPTNDSRSRQSWACSDRKGNQQTSRLDFKRLLLQKSSNFLSGGNKKISAVEQLKMSKQQLSKPSSPPTNDMSILELSGSPRSLVNRKFSPEKINSNPPKILSPRSQWRFANPRSDVLSSTILEDCREDESSPNSSGEKNSSKKLVFPSVSERMQAQRAQFFNNSNNSGPQSSSSPSRDQEKIVYDPLLETAF